MEKMDLTIEDLKHIAKEYEELLHEHAYLHYFNEEAKKHLTEEQLELIEEKLNDIPEYSSLG